MKTHGKETTKPGFKTKSGKVLPYGEWVPLCEGFSICPMKRIHKVRYDVTGEIKKPPFKIGPGNDSLMMALYTESIPVAYLNYLFGNAATAHLDGGINQ